MILTRNKLIIFTKISISFSKERINKKKDKTNNQKQKILIFRKEVSLRLIINGRYKLLNPPINDGIVKKKA